MKIYYFINDDIEILIESAGVVKSMPTDLLKRLTSYISGTIGSIGKKSMSLAKGVARFLHMPQDMQDQASYLLQSILSSPEQFNKYVSKIQDKELKRDLFDYIKGRTDDNYGIMN